MWYMTEERRVLQQMVRRFAQNEIKPFVPKMENQEEYPREILRKLGKLGVLGLSQEKKYGGSGNDWINFGIALEEIAKVSNTVALLTALTTPITVSIVKDSCTDEQIEKFIKPAVRGDRLLGFWATEPCGIMDMGEYQTTAVQKDGKWIINGGKIFSTNGQVADYGITFCRTGKYNPKTGEGITCFFVPTDVKGFIKGNDEHKLGWHGSDTCHIKFDHIELSDEYRIGPLNKANQYNTPKTLDIYPFYGAMALGSAEYVFNKTLNFLKNRVQSGISIWDAHEAVRVEMAELYAKIENFRGTIYSTLANYNQKQGNPAEAIAIKLAAVDLLVEVTKRCIILNGGSGTVKDTDIERFYRDAMMMSVGCGSNGMLKTSLSMML